MPIDLLTLRCIHAMSRRHSFSRPVRLVAVATLLLAPHPALRAQATSTAAIDRVAAVLAKNAPPPAAG